MVWECGTVFSVIRGVVLIFTHIFIWGVHSDIPRPTIPHGSIMWHSLREGTRSNS